MQKAYQIGLKFVIQDQARREKINEIEFKNEGWELFKIDPP